MKKKWTDKHRKILWICLTPLAPVLLPLGWCVGRYKEWEGKRHDARYRHDAKYRAKSDAYVAKIERRRAKQK